MRTELYSARLRTPTFPRLELGSYSFLLPRLCSRFAEILRKIQFQQQFTLFFPSISGTLCAHILTING
jgi:hypothetical protein